MKKFKEFLFFPLALILLIVIFLALFILLMPNGTYYSGFEYIKLMLKDEYFLPAMFITFSIPLLISSGASVIATAVMAFLKWKKNMKITRVNFFFTNALLSCGFSFAYFAVFTNALQKTDEMNVTFQMTVYAIIFSIIVAVLITFVLWLVEFITTVITKFIKNSKNDSNSSKTEE